MRLWKHNWSKELEKMEKREIKIETKNLINSEVSHLKSVYFCKYFLSDNKNGKFKEKLKKTSWDFENT